MTIKKEKPSASLFSYMKKIGKIYLKKSKAYAIMLFVKIRLAGYSNEKKYNCIDVKFSMRIQRV